MPLVPICRVLPLLLLVANIGGASHAAAQTTAPASRIGAEASAAASAASTPAGVSVERLQREIEALQGLQDGRLSREMPLPALFEIDLADAAVVTKRIDALAARLATEAPATSDETEVLRRTRDTLRLAFLRLPTERRDALREQDRLQRAGEQLAEEKSRSAADLAAAEQARDSALAAARVAADSAERVLASEEARLLARLSEVSSLRQAGVERKQALVKKYRELLLRYGASAAGLTLAPADADARYGEIRAVLRQLRADAGRALDAVSAPDPVRSVDPGPALDGLAYASRPEAVARIRELRAKVLVEETATGLREAEDRYADAQEVMGALRALQLRRLALLPLLGEARHAEATGFTREGLDRVLSEIEFVRLSARWYPIQRLHDAQDFALLLRNAFTAGRVGASALGGLLALGLIVFAYRRSRQHLNSLRTWLVPRIGMPSMRVLVESGLQMLTRVSRELVLLFAVYLLFDQLLVGRVGLPELDTLRELAYAYAIYKLALTFLHRIVLQAVARYQQVGPALNAKILGSLRLVARGTLLYAVYLILAQALLGRGALYGIAREVALVSALGVGWWLIRAWRQEVAAAYLAFSPEGRLAVLVRASQDRSHGIFIAAAAFVFVAARGLWIWLRDTALRFEQTRKALAYLFRRQLERQSKNQPPAPDPSQLPPDLQAALSEDPASPSLIIEVFPHLQSVKARAVGLAQGEPGALVALVGERGAGKSSWLQELRRQVNQALPCTLYSLDQRATSSQAACRALAEALGLAPCDNPQEMAQQLLQQPPQLVLVDLAHNLFLRSVGGLAGHSALISVAQATLGRVLWVLAYAHWPFQYLQRTLPGRDVYDQVVTLEAWTEAQIGQLIDTRMSAAGYVADYDKLLLSAPVVRAGPSHPVGAAGGGEAAERSADRYQRLVWDYANGNPRVALHFFRLSLVWRHGKTVDVRLFAIPSVDALEHFETRTWLTLACLVHHENLTVEEAAQSLRFPRAECERALHLLHGHEFLTRSDDGRYRVTSHWFRAAQRFLQRKKLLFV